MRIVTAEAARKIDRDAMDLRGVAGTALMEAAGTAVADSALALCRRRNLSRVQVFCGKGNNGGDGYVAAEKLKKAGLRVEVFAFTEASEIRGDAKHHYDKMRAAGIGPLHTADARELRSRLAKESCWIDAVFGTGLDRPVAGPLRELMECLHDAHSKQPVIAVDIPSGIHGTNGALLGPALRAEETVCMGFFKTGNFLRDGKAYCGKRVPAELDYPEISFRHARPEIRNFDHTEARERLRPVPVTGHKYTMGEVLCLGGSAAMPGAAILASRAVLLSGAGMLRALVPGRVKELLLTHLIEAVVHTAADPGILSERDLPQLRRLAKDKSRVILAGPGFGRAAESGRLLRAVLDSAALPLVLDADALWHLKPQHLRSCSAPAVITPHAGEFARLLDRSTEEVLDAPLELAKAFADTNGTIVHLKGSTSITALPGAGVFLHAGGAPGMATAGSGDVLAGMIASFIAQGHAPEAAVPLAAWYHGAAGKAAAAALGNRSVTASALLAYLPAVLKSDEVLA